MSNFQEGSLPQPFWLFLLSDVNGTPQVIVVPSENGSAERAGVHLTSANYTPQHRHPAGPDIDHGTSEYPKCGLIHVSYVKSMKTITTEYT